MGNQASINPTSDHLALRNIGRIKTLRGSIDKHTARGNAQKVAELQSELDRRLEQVSMLRAELDSL